MLPLTLLLTLWVHSIAPLAAQSPPDSFDETLDVRVVSLDVFVTDKKGQPVTGLQREDFRVLEDGQQVAIVNFARQSQSMAEAGMPEPMAEGVVIESTETPPPAPASDRRDSIVLYIDNSTLIAAHRNRVLEDLQEFVLRQSRRRSQFMLVVFNPGLEIVTPMTTNAELVSTALGDLARTAASGQAAVRDRRAALQHIQDIYRLFEEPNTPPPCSIGWEQMVAAADTYAMASTHRVSTAQSGLLALVRSLGGIPGRKALVYLSDGLEQRPGLDLYDYLSAICPDREREISSFFTRWDETRLYQELAAYANAHQVTLYPLETAGLRNFSRSSVEFSSSFFAPSPRNDSIRIANLQSSLFIMADETGGQAFFNANFPSRELDRMARDFDEYYALGFTPRYGWDGGEHNIRVELVGKAAKGVSLRYRRRYQAIPEDERMAERTLAALVLGWEENPLGTEIRVGERRALPEGTWEVPVEIVLPMKSLGSIAGPSGERRLVRVLMMAEDAQSRRTPMRERLIPLEPTPEAEGGEEGVEERTFIVHVELEAGTHKIAVGVRDELNRIASYHRTTVELAKAEKSPGP